MGKCQSVDLIASLNDNLPFSLKMIRRPSWNLHDIVRIWDEKLCLQIGFTEKENEVIVNAIRDPDIRNLVTPRANTGLGTLVVCMVLFYCFNKNKTFRVQQVHNKLFWDRFKLLESSINSGPLELYADVEHLKKLLY